jgi:hypothetical protein
MHLSEAFWNVAKFLQILYSKWKYMSTACFIFSWYLCCFAQLDCSDQPTRHLCVWDWLNCQTDWEVLAVVQYTWIEWKDLQNHWSCVCVCVCLYFVCKGHSLVYTTVNLLQTTESSEMQTFLYGLLYCHKHRQFGAGCCIIWNTDSYAVCRTVTAHIRDIRSAVAMWQ